MTSITAKLGPDGVVIVKSGNHIVIAYHSNKVNSQNALIATEACARSF
ncbi:hypothetical protein DFA_03319 [Cavenderia fasciculata]|uniref:Profilin n=1 Tax=Cavenderia fasciculata TaxID=261658 RepID=F4PH89_CACFS|nr:uncharacterized protein DFA_03319 [Cavenderia fasciculata]EGG25073.1 hypothetical protein DFA_03319 [Cavenderia fasciculata]|eukprot:XP_004362924.1 hypothetical protein DFA_03319 [Cavenderia fasciculata]